MKLKPPGFFRSATCVALGLIAFATAIASEGTVIGSTVQPVRLAPRLAIPVAQSPHSVFADDLNGDGRLDLIISAAGANQVVVLDRKDDGGLAAPRSFDVGTAPKHAVTGDFNGDGKRDIVVAEQNVNSMGVLLGNGDGTFRERVAYESCVGPHELLVTDLNADGREDVVVACSGASNASAFLGTGDGRFLPGQSLATGAAPQSVGAADFNDDGLQDLAFASRNSRAVSVLLQRPDGSFEPANNLPVGGSPHGIAVRDLDQDGDVDIVTVNDYGEGVSVLWGRPNGFESHTDLPGIASPKSIAVADINGDTRLDLLITTTTYPDCCTAQGSNVRIYLNSGNRRFLDPQDSFVGGNPFSLWVGDLNRDGLTDIATANYHDMPESLYRLHPFVTSGSRKAELLRLVAVAALGLLVAATIWKRSRIASLAAAATVMAGAVGLLLWVGSQKNLSHISLLMGN